MTSGARGRRSVWLAVALAGVVAAALATLGLARAGATHRTNSFDGSCSLQGTVAFTPPATNEQQPLTADFKGPGTCSGTLNGREVSDVKVHATNLARNVDGSCMRAETTEPGTGTLTFPDGTTIYTTVEFEFHGTAGTLTFKGEISGEGSGIGNFANDRGSPEIILQCGGEGVKSAPLDIMLMGDTPLVSRHRGSGGRRGGGGRGRSDDGDRARKRRRHLRLRVRPRRVRAGRRTTFRFGVTTSSGRRKNGATVRFAGRRARSKRGRARITVTLRRRGRHMARATRRGYGSARRAVIVR
jgi:hypothetical protein